MKIAILIALFILSVNASVKISLKPLYSAYEQFQR